MEKYKAVENLVARGHGGHYFLMNPELPGWFVGSKKACDTLELMDGSRNREEIIDELEKLHEMPREHLFKDYDELLEVLKKKGFIEGVKGNVPKFERRLDTFHLHLTHKCNLRCRYCYLDAGSSLENELSTEEIKNVVDQAKELGGETQMAALTGGEPMIHPDFWEIAEYVKSKGINMVLATNGSFVTEENAPRLKDLFYEVQVSLDGLKDIHEQMRGRGSFDKAVSAIRHLADAGCHVKLSAVVSKHNLDRIYEIADLAVEYGAKSIKTAVMLPFGKADEELALSPEEFVQFWNKMTRTLVEKNVGVEYSNEGTNSGFLQPILGGAHPCGAGIISLSVDSDGSVYPCQSAHQPEFLAGNVRERSLEDIWKNSEGLRTWQELSIDDIEECSPCIWRKYCGGGCRTQAYAYQKSIKKPIPFCDLMKSFYSEGVDKYLEWLAGRDKRKES